VDIAEAKENRLLRELTLRNECRETVRVEPVEHRFPMDGSFPAWRAKEKGANERGRFP